MREFTYLGSIVSMEGRMGRKAEGGMDVVIV